MPPPYASLTLFADESGNTGLHHLDRAQPTYVLAGWLVENGKIEPARSAVRAARAAMTHSELSGPQLLKTTMGRRVALDLLGALGAVASPFVVAVEKRFALAARMAHEFLDFEHNPRADRAFILDKTRARASAHEFLALPIAAFEAANEWIRRPSRATTEQCLSAVIDGFRSVGKPDLADILAGARGDAGAGPHVMELEHAAGASPNAAAFTSALAMLEQLSVMSAEPLRIVHDETKFRTTFDHHHALAASGLPHVAFPELMAAAGYPMLRNVAPAAYADSKTEPMIEGADVLAGLCASLLARVVAGGAWDRDGERELARLTLAGFLVEDAALFFHWVGSDGLAAAMTREMFAEADGA